MKSKRADIDEIRMMGEAEGNAALVALCDDADALEEAEARAASAMADRSELLAERNGVEAERDHYRRAMNVQMERATEAEADLRIMTEVRERGCQCGDDEVCEFVRDRDAAEARAKAAEERWRKEAEAYQDATHDYYALQRRLDGLVSEVRGVRDTMEEQLNDYDGIRESGISVLEKYQEELQRLLESARDPNA